MKRLRVLMQEFVSEGNNQGFSLVELMIATIILSFGLLAAAQFLYITMELNSLARSKATATITAQKTMEHLAGLYKQNPDSEEFQPGSHGPQEVAVKNPLNGMLLNLYSVTWTVEDVSDPRPDRQLKARQVCLKVYPIREGGSDNFRPFFNKVLSITTVFSHKMR